MCVCVTVRARETEIGQCCTNSTPMSMLQAMIEEKVEEEETFRATAAVKAANREQRKPEKRTAEGGREKVVLPSRGEWSRTRGKHSCCTHDAMTVV